MGGFGTLYMYSERRLPQPVDVLQQCISTLEGHSGYVYRTLEQERGLEAAMRTFQKLAGRLLYSSAEIEDEFIKIEDRVDGNQMPSYYVEGSALSVGFTSSGAERLLWDGYDTYDSKAVLGDLRPHMVSIIIGYHDLVCSDEETGEPLPIARPFIAFGFSGQGYAQDSNEAVLTCILQNPALIELRTRLEEIVGPLTPHVELSY